MKIAITGASGFVGRALVLRLSQKAHSVQPVSLRQGLSPHSFSDCDAVVHLAGEPVAQRWTSAVRQRIMNSRVDGTRMVLEALRNSPARILVSASAVGYYGSRGDEILTETSAPANDFLGQVAVAWEAEAMRATEFGIRVVSPRIGVVLGRGGGALARMLLPFKMGIGGRLGSGNQWMSWIHLDDLTALIEFAFLNHTLRGPINAAAPNPVTNADFTKALGGVLHRPAFMPVPGFALKLLFGEMSRVLLEGQRVIPAAATEAGFKFRYPSIEEALREAVS